MERGEHTRLGECKWAGVGVNVCMYAWQHEKRERERNWELGKEKGRNPRARASTDGLFFLIPRGMRKLHVAVGEQFDRMKRPSCSM